MSNHLNPLDVLLEVPETPGRTIDLQWGYITSLVPLRLRNEHEADEIQVTPSRLCDVALGDRVYYVHQGRKIVILGVALGRSPGWVTWQPTLTGTISNPTMGNSWRGGRFKVESDGTVHFTGQIVIGSSFSAGEGSYSCSIPVLAYDVIDWPVDVHLTADSAVGGIGDAFGDGRIEGGASIARLYVLKDDGTRSFVHRIGSSTGLAAGDRIFVHGTYEKA